MCIMVTCVRVKNLCIAHAYKHHGQEWYIHECIRVKVQDHRYVHHTHIDQSQGSRIIDMCIIHTCIRVKDQGTLINTSYTDVSGSYILLLESPCPFVRPLVRYRKISHHRYMHHTYTHASGSRIEDHRYVHHTHIDQSQGSRIIDMCIIHTCSIVKDRGT